MKKIFKLLLIVAFALFIVSCDKKTTTTTTNLTSAQDLPPTFSGVADKSIVQGDEFNPITGVTANDAEDGVLTTAIVVSGTYDVDTVGTYPITLTVTDSANHTVTISFNLVVTVKVLTNLEKAALDIEAVNFDNGIVLPLFGANGSYFYWSSSNPLVITNRGFIINPPVGSDPVVVTLTARVQNGAAQLTEEFEVTVQPNSEVTVTSKVSVPFEGTSEEYVVPNQEAVDLFFVDNGNLPYIDAETFVDMVNGALESDIIVFTPVGEDGLSITYEVEYEDFDGTILNLTYTAYIDFTENTFTVNNFDFFGNYVASTESDYGEGLNYIDADYVDGNEVTIPLGDYNFDLVIYQDGEKTVYLMPLCVTNLLFVGGVYYDVYYNGDKLWGIDTFGLSGGDEDDLALQDTIRESSLNGVAMPLDTRWATYHYMALALDYFYGLKEDNDVTTYYNYLVGYVENIITKGDLTVYRTIFDLAYKLDDLHTSHIFPGYYEAPYSLGLSISDLGPESTDFYEGLWAVQDLLTAKYGSREDMPAFSLIDGGKTVVIHLTGFTIDTPVEFKAILDGLNALVENVVIDLAYNTGGNLGAVLRIFGYMTENPIMYHSQNPADGSAVTYYIESDYVAYDYNWYILTSSVTFSAANLMASIAKEQGIATLIGQPSSGGASSIGVVLLPDGSAWMISTNNVLSTRIGNEVDGYDYVSIEHGIEVDIEISDVTSDAQLIAAIAQDQAE